MKINDCNTCLHEDKDVNDQPCCGCGQDREGYVNKYNRRRADVCDTPCA